ncbi:MAG: hypothetical protein EXR94_06990 [Gemmatimonadetes bacterium]|nr:hypothetical protein [Gemmatimonadota bacterium]
MSTPAKRGPARLILGLLVLVVVIVGFIQRDTIAGLILKGGDVPLTGEAAQSSPDAKLAIDFLAALRGADQDMLGQLTTAEQAVRIRQESDQPTPEYQDTKSMMLADLPAEPADLQARIKSVKIHENRGMVTFETKANSWFVTLEQVNGAWNVAGF